MNTAHAQVDEVRSRDTGRRRSRVGASRVQVWALIPVLALGLAACANTTSGATTAATTSGATTSGATTAATGKGNLVAATVAPFTGPDAVIGPLIQAGCISAAHTINAAGGINGQDIECKVFDTRGDPADAVPAVRQMLATTSNVVLVNGLSSDEAASVVPVLNARKIVMFAATGQSEFDKSNFAYFHRLMAPDAAEAYAMVAIAKQKGYQRVAIAYGNDIGSQTFLQPTIDAAAKAGMKVVANETLDLKASTFRTEASKIVAAKPDVIFTEAIGSADATFLGEIKQLNGGKTLPIIGTQTTIDPAWYKAVSASIGAKDLADNYMADNVAIATTGAAYSVFKDAVTAVKNQIGNPDNLATYLSGTGVVHMYDGTILSALAMVKAKSTDPTVYNKEIVGIGNGTPGAVEVSSYAEGVKAIKEGKAIRFVGPGGPTQFNQYNNSLGLFEINAFDVTGAVRVLGPVSAAEIKALGG